MTKLIVLLTMFYSCDVAITEGHATHKDFGRCLAVSDQLSARFLTERERITLSTLGPSDRRARLTTGYNRFRAWEVENELTVRHLRFQARARVRGDETV